MHTVSSGPKFRISPMSCEITSLDMMTASNGIFLRYWPFFLGGGWGWGWGWGGDETTGHRWIPLTKISDAELWCFLWAAPEQTVEQTLEMPVIWDAIALITTSLLWAGVILFKTNNTAQHYQNKKYTCLFCFVISGFWHLCGRWIQNRLKTSLTPISPPCTCPQFAVPYFEVYTQKLFPGE